MSFGNRSIKNMFKPFYLLIIIVFLYSCNSKKEDNQSMPLGPAPGQPVQVIIVGLSSLNNSISATGTIMSNEEVEIRSETQGRVTGLYFKEGQAVQKGKLLIKIDDSELQAQLKKTELSIQLAKDDELRKKKLFEISGISREEYDGSINSLAKLQADKELLQVQISKTSINAPFSGIIGLRYISEGGYVSSSNLIAVLQQSDPVKIEFSVPEKYAIKLKTGATIDFTVEGNIKNFSARIYAIEPKIDPSTRTIKVRAISANANHELIPGAFAKLQITLATLNEAMVLPSEALIPNIKGQSVMIVKNGKAVLQQVIPGIRTENETQITDGINQGDTIIVSGLLTVREGMDVKPILMDSKKEIK